MKERTSSEAKQIVKSGTEAKKVFSTIMDKEVTLSTRKTAVLNRKPEKKTKIVQKVFDKSECRKIPGKASMLAKSFVSAKNLRGRLVFKMKKNPMVPKKYQIGDPQAPVDINYKPKGLNA